MLKKILCVFLSALLVGLCLLPAEYSGLCLLPAAYSGLCFVNSVYQTGKIFDNSFRLAVISSNLRHLSSRFS